MTTVLRCTPQQNIEPHYELLRMEDNDGLHLSDFDIVGDRYVHQPRTDCTGCRDEFGFGVSVANVRNSSLRRFNSNDCWGDGVHIGYNRPSAPNNYLGPAEGFHLEDFSLINNRRNGLSIVGGRNISLVNGLIDGGGIVGVPEGAGIDIEPERHDTPVDGVYGRNLLIKNNDRVGIMVNNPAAIPMRNIHFDEIEVDQSQRGWSLWMVCSPGANVIQNSTIRGPAVHLHFMVFSRVKFYSRPDYPFAIDLNQQTPCAFYHCEVDNEPLVRNHPKVRLIGSAYTVEY